MRIVTLFLIIIMLSSGIALSSLGLKLTKTCDAYDADIEETVNYTYFVENTGNENLFSLNLVDDRLGTIPLSQTTLAPGVNLSVTFEHKINKTDMPGPLRNNANATALGPSVEPVVSNTASFQLALGFGGHIDVKKSLVSTPTPINIGKMVIYRITVKNPNTVPLHDVRITQDVLYSPYAIINTTLTLDKNYLAPGDTATGYYVYIVKENDILGPPGSHAPTGQFDISNTVDAEANPPWESVGGNSVTSYFQKNVPGKYSSNSVVKKFASPTEGGINTEITFKIFVNNTGDTLLNRTELWDLLPFGLDYVSSSPVAVPTPHVNGTTTLYWTNLSQTLGILLVGGKYEVEVKAKISGRNLGTLTNKAISKSYNLRNEFNTSINETPIIVRKQNLSVVKTSDISSGGPGALVNFSLTVKNTGNITLKSVFVNDLLPLGMIYQSSWPAGSNNQQYVNWPDIGSMMPDTSKQLWIEAVINGPISENKTLTNRVNVAGKPEYGSNVTANDTASVEAFGPNISVIKTSDFTFGSAGAVINFTLNVTNIGSGLLPHVFVCDLLPTGMSYVSSSSGSTNTGQTVNWGDIGPLGSGAGKMLWIVAHIDGPVSGIRTLTNRVDVEGKPEHGNNVTNNTTTTVEAREPKITVTKTADPTFGSPSTNVNFTLVVNNTGSTLLPHVFVTDLLPAGMSYVSSSSGSTNTGQTVSWSDIGPLGFGERKQLWIVAQIDGPVSGIRTLTNRVDVEGKPEHGQNVTNRSTADVRAQEANIQVTKTADPTFGSPSTNVNFTLVVNNSGSTPLPHVFVSDLLPSGMSYVSSSSGSTQSGQTVSWSDIGPLSSGERKVLWIVAHIDGPINGIRIFTNRVDVQGKPEHGQNVTNSSTADVNAEGANIMIQKTANPTFGSPSTNVNFTLVVNNTGSTPLPHVFVCDLLPAGMSYVSSSIGSMHSGQTVSWSDIGPLGFGERKQLWIVAQIDGPVSGIQTLTNRVDVEGKPEHGQNVTNSSTADVRAQEANIQVTKTADPTFGSPSTNVNFTLVVNNSGSTPLPHVFVSDLLPSGMSYVSSSSGSTQSGQTVSWSDIGPLSSGERKVLWIVAQIDGPVSGIRTLTNRVDVEGKPEHGQNVTNSSTADVNAEGANIMVSKTGDPTFGSVGTLINFTLNVTNNGAALLQNVSVSDKLPGGLTYDSSSTGSGNNGRYVNWTEIGPMPVGDMKSLWIKAKIDGTVYGTLTNLVFVTGKPPRGDPVTNSTTKDVTALKLSISGRKFNDLDGDGNHDGDPDPGLAGWTIELVNLTTGQVVRSIITNEGGLYQMDNVIRGKYIVREVQQPGWQQTCPVQGIYSINTDDSDLTGIDFGNRRISEINVTKVADPTFAPPGTNITFDIEIVNKGETTLSQVTAVDTLPAGMTYVSDNRSGSVSESTISWNDLGDFAPDASKGIELVGRMDSGVSGVLTNVVDVTAKDPGGNDLNDTATANVTAFRPNIEVTKNAISYAELPPTDITYIIMIINSGDILLDPVWANDTLVAGLGYVSDNRSGIVSGNSIAWNNLGSLAPGECTYISMVTHADRGVWGVENQVDVTGKPPIGNNVTNSTTTGYNWQPPVIYGQKFNDLNGNGTNDDYTDPGIPNWTIELVNESREVVNSNTTDENGNYWIGPVSRGNYTVREVQQPGWQQTCPAQGSYSINTDDSDLTGIDFGNRWISEINVTKVAYPTSASPGANISFVINISNNGKTHLSHVHAVDTLPPGMSYISDDLDGSVSGINISWNDLDDLDPGASNAIHLVAMIDRNISGRLIDVVYVNATDPAGGEVNDSALAEVRSLLPKIKVNKTLEPVQYGQYCEAKTISGVGIIESRTSIEDKTIALEYDDALAGEGEIELESAEVMSEAAEKLQRDVPSLDPENQSSLNLFADTKLAFKGAKPLTGGKSIHSMAFYGGSGARIKDIFSAEEMEKEQTIYSSSTDKASSPQTIGTDLKSSFNGTIETDSKMHNMFRQDINSRQLFSGVFNLDKVIKFHKNVTTDEPKMGCDGIDC